MSNLPYTAMGIRCPECKIGGSKIIDSRTTREEMVAPNLSQSLFYNAQRRRHLCQNGHRFTTFEIIDTELIKLKDQPIDPQTQLDIRLGRVIREILLHDLKNVVPGLL